LSCCDAPLLEVGRDYVVQMSPATGTVAWCRWEVTSTTATLTMPASGAFFFLYGCYGGPACDSVVFLFDFTAPGPPYVITGLTPGDTICIRVVNEFPILPFTVRLDSP